MAGKAALSAEARKAATSAEAGKAAPAAESGAPCRFLWTFLVLSLLLPVPAHAGDRAGDADSLPGWLGAIFPKKTADPSKAAAAKEEECSASADGTCEMGTRRILMLHAWRPRAFLYKHFLTDEECDHIVAMAQPQLHRSQVVSTNGSGEVSEARTSSGMFVGKGQDDVIKSIEQRISEWTFLPIANQEPLQVLRYTEGQKYEAHHDYFTDEQHSQQGGHRYATVLMYLNNVTKGGETVFPNVKDDTPKDDSWTDCAKGQLAVKPSKGDALLFFSMFPDGSPDENSLHYACPVVEGEKWSAPKWVHVRDYDAPVDATSAGGALACIDTNGLCETWAAAGECERNARYMVGEGAIVGACRKSCGVCGSEGEAQ